MIAGLVVTLHEDETLIADAMQTLQQWNHVDVGDRTGRRLPVVIDATSVRHSHEITDSLRALSGVIHVDVAYVDYESDQQSTLSNQEQESGG